MITLSTRKEAMNKKNIVKLRVWEQIRLLNYWNKGWPTVLWHGDNFVWAQKILNSKLLLMMKYFLFLININMNCKKTTHIDTIYAINSNKTEIRNGKNHQNWHFWPYLGLWSIITFFAWLCPKFLFFANERHIKIWLLSNFGVCERPWRDNILTFVLK